MNSKRLAVFAASMQWADAVKVVSRGTRRSRTSVIWGIRWTVSGAEKDGESGGRFPTVRQYRKAEPRINPIQNFSNL